MPPGTASKHHLVPKSKGGRATELLHTACHNQIHALFSESQLAKRYNTVESLMEDPRMVEFVEWIRKKPPDFTVQTKRGWK